MLGNEGLQFVLRRKAFFFERFKPSLLIAGCRYALSSALLGEVRGSPPDRSRPPARRAARNTRARAYSGGSAPPYDWTF